VLALLAKLDATLKAAVDAFDFNSYVRALTDFCNEDLSAFFFDIRKDCLYCDAPTDPKRMAYRTVLDTLFHALIRYAAPVLVFTGEEVWKSRFPEADSVHLLEWPVVQLVEVVENRWEAARYLRSIANEAIEGLRRDKIVGSGLQADVEIHALESMPERLEGLDLSELFIAASVSLMAKPDDTPSEATVTKTTHHKCGRCWRHLPEVAEDGDLCSRCDQVVSGMDAA
jgi:isoleucyl-tRNA synthetase